MDKFLIANLEGYLSGQLGESKRRRFKDRLAKRSKDCRTVEEMASVSGLFESLDLPPRDGLGPSPGFHARVLDRIERERRPPFWDLFLRPAVMRRSAVAACAWLLVLFSAALYQSSAQASVNDLARTILAKPPESADYCNVRLGCDIDLNRSSMLAAVMVSGAGGR